jgi:geranylgeranyl reductase family protein
MKVALLEKHRLPRHKTCGGGMPMTVGSLLRDLAPAAFIESEVQWMRHTWNFAQPHLEAVNPPGSAPISLWMTQRSVFDHALARRAAEAGAELIDSCAVRSVELGEAGVSVAALQGDRGAPLALRSRFVIGADGANGVVAREAGLCRRRRLAIGMEIEHPHRWRSGDTDLRPDVLHLEYGAVPNGYAWVFPKGDHLNVGAGLFRPRSSDGRGDSEAAAELRAAIVGYLKMLGVAYFPGETRFHAHPLPLWNGKEPRNTRDGRILLVGDAASLVNPLFGDGILHAVRSGLIAARCLVEGRPRDYTDRLHREIAAEFEAARRLSGLFYQWPGLAYRHAVTRPGATRAAARLLCGEALFSDVASRAGRRLRRALRARATA